MESKDELIKAKKQKKAEYDREYRKRNKEHIAEYQRAWAKKNALRISDKRHEYYMKHKKEKQMKKISKEIREFDEWLERKYANREYKDNIFPVGITDGEFVEWAIRILLGDDWYIAFPVSQNQVNELAMEDIIFHKCGMEAKDRKEKENGKQRADQQSQEKR